MIPQVNRRWGRHIDFETVAEPALLSLGGAALTVEGVMPPPSQADTTQLGALRQACHFIRLRSEAVRNDWQPKTHADAIDHSVATMVAPSVRQAV